jgi:hypothetical protein
MGFFVTTIKEAYCNASDRTPDHVVVLFLTGAIGFFWNFANDDNMSDKISCNLELYTK